VAIGGHRKVVTVLFCDVVGSTALGESVDAEALQRVLARYFERMKGILESHGGSVEKFIGDAVMAVFGVPVAHEDDALRACRAAVEMREALPELGVEGRIGVNTGEVLTGTEERLATGDAVNLAARLEQAAKPGEILIGGETLGLVGSAVEVGEEQLLDLKGKNEAIVAHPLLSLRDVAERSHASRFVGRTRELEQLVDAWQRALAGPGCEMVTVIGDPGVGKSRLVAEALAQIDARVVWGRCLSYGEGVTYWPVVEAVKQLDALPADEFAAEAIRSLLGESDPSSGTDEIAWAFRKLLEEQAPLVVCFDDIQWGEETFLDLVESTALLATGAPLLLICMARPELLDRRPRWLTTLPLDPLPEPAAIELVGDAVPEGVRERIVRASGGNPLFVTEMLALTDQGEDVEVPATLRAVLAARLDQLDEAERRVLERGAVEGELFHRGTVQALAPEETEVTPRLAALVRRHLIRPDVPQLPREDAYRFRHLLIRDAAYDALPKATRADLHRHFAAWLEEHGQSLVELDEILGYHLEQACWYRAELGLGIEDDLRSSARRHLTDAGRRALSRQDLTAASQLLRRALVLVPENEVDVPLEIDLAFALFGAGNGDEAFRSLDALAERSSVVGDPVGEICSRLGRGIFATNLGPHGGVRRLDRLTEEVGPVLEAAEDQHALYLLHSARGIVAQNLIRRDTELAELEQAAYHARLAGLPHLAAQSLRTQSGARFYGSMPLTQLLTWLEEHESEHGHREWRLTHWRAFTLAMLGRFDEARPILAEFLRVVEERGDLLSLGQYRSHSATRLELLAGDPAAALKHAEEGCRLLEELGERGFLSTSYCYLGQALYELDRLDEAKDWARKGSELGDSDDLATQTLSRQVQARVAARRGQHAKAETLAREAVALIDSTDCLDSQGETRRDLAEVLELAGRRDEATALLTEALDRYQRKEALVSASRVRERLSVLQETPI
jgi:class 3 adenylate cyclase/tetratricopeptide (TPR) repeat protein